MKLKKLIASFLSISMLVSAMPIISNAALRPDMTKAKYSMVLLKEAPTGDANAGKYVEVAPTTLTPNTTDTFFVGIKVEDMDHIEEVNNFVDGSGELGLSSIGVGIAYNSEYVQYEPNARNASTGAVTTSTVRTRLGTRIKKAMVKQSDGSYTAAYYIHGNDEYGDGLYSYSLATLGENSISGEANTTKGYTHTSGIAIASASQESSDPTNYSGNLNTYLGIFEFKFTDKAITDIANGNITGKRVVGFAATSGYTTITFGAGASAVTYQDKRAAGDIETIIERDDSGVDFFPAGAPVLDSLEIKTAGYALPAQYAPRALSLGTIEYTAKYTNDGADKNLTSSQVKYYYGATGKTAAEVADLTEVPAKLTTALNKQYLYAVYTEGSATAIKEIGQMSVTQDSIASITEKGKAPTTAFVGAAPSFTGLSLQFNCASNPTSLYYTKAYAAFGSALAASDGITYTPTLYMKNGDATGSNVSVTTTIPAKYATAGTYTFYVADAGKTQINTATTGGDVYYTFDVTVSENNSTLTNVTPVTKTKYGAGKKVDLSSATFTLTPASGTASTLPYANAKDQLTFFWADSATGAYAADKIITDPDNITYNSATMRGKYIRAVSRTVTGTAQTVVGPLGDRAIAKATTGNTATLSAATATYGATAATIFDGTQKAAVTLTYDNGDKETFTYSAADGFKTTDGLKLADENVSVKIGGTAFGTATDLIPVGAATKVEFVYDNTTVASANVKVDKKAVKVLVDGTPNVSKAYDGTADVEDGDIAVKIDEADLVAADSLAGKIGVTGLKFVYDNKNVTGAKDKAISIKSGTAAAAATAGTGAAADVTKFNANYTLGVVDLSAVKGEITKKDLTIDKITVAETVKAGATGNDAIVNGTMALKNNSASDKNCDMVKGDTLSVKFKATFTNTATEGKTTDITLADVTLDGADKGNYNLTNAATVTAEGEVSNDPITGIAITTPATKLTYTYPDLVLDTTGIVVTATKQSGATSDVTASTQFAPTTLTTYGDDIVITATYSGQTATYKVKVQKKTIDVANDIVFTATKAAGADEVTVTGTFKDGVLADGDDAKITLTATGAFKDNEPGDDKPVDITDIAITGDAAGNYVLSGTTATGTGSIVAGSQTAPASIEASVDNKTNNIVVTEPTGTNVEYSINAGEADEKWQDETTFTGLTAGTDYTVSARYKKTATDAASPAVTKQVTTYKYHVVVKTVNASATAKPIAEIYTNTDTAANDDAVHAVIGGKPARFKAYYTDVKGTTAIAYPFTLATETELYITRSDESSGGGSRSITYTVTFDAGENGKIVKGNTTTRVTQGVKMRTAAIPTITANEGYEFKGWSLDGETVDPTKVDITKAITFEAVYEKVEPTPTPGATEEPTIPANYNKPYAGGYDEGDFRPDNNITRAELAAMIARLSYEDELPDNTYSASFWDVDANAWYNKYIGYLEGLRIFDGYEDGSFQPTNNVTRGELCAVITRAQRFAIIPSDGMFWDVTSEDWAKDYIATLAQKGIVSGYEDGSFGPNRPLTRAEAVTMINKLLAPSTPNVTFTPWDIEGHWAKDEIILAVNERSIIEEEATPAPVPEETTEPEETAAPESDATPAPETDATPAPEAETTPAPEA